MSTLFHILALSIVMPVIAGFISFRQVKARGYLPVLVFFIAGAANNLVSFILIKKKLSNHLNSNLYVLAALLLLLWQFWSWNASSSRKYLALALLLTAVWITDNLVLNSIRNNNSIFRIVSSFTVLYLAIDHLNRQIFFNYRKIILNPVFLFCATLLIYYTLRVFIEMFFLFGQLFGTVLIIQLNYTLAFANLVTNVLFSLAFLCLRLKPTYYKY